MVQIYWRSRPLYALFRRFAAAAESHPSACHDWLRDPLNHPVVDAMSLSELADLPAGQLRSYCRE